MKSHILFTVYSIHVYLCNGIYYIAYIITLQNRLNDNQTVVIKNVSLFLRSNKDSIISDIYHT